MTDVASVVGRRESRSNESKYQRAAQMMPELKQLLSRLFEEQQGPTFGELAAGWLKRIARRRVQPANERGHVRHMGPLLHLREGELTKSSIDDLFGSLLKPTGPLGPSTVNKLRSTGRLIIRDAQGNNEWRGINPFELVRRMRQVEPVYNVLSVDEVALVLPHLREDRRRLAKTILLIGLRPGEALGLQKVDVDLEKRVIRVCRSHGRNQTKTGKERAFPIPDGLVDDLRSAMSDSPSGLVFPKADGSRQRADTKLAKILRTAMKAARLVTGYRYHCRRKGCGFKEDLEAEVELCCPHCSMRLWCEPIPKPLRFYDLRHSSATLHREARCDPLVIQKMLGHATDNTTDSTYTHLGEAYRREQVNKLHLKDGLDEKP